MNHRTSGEKMKCFMNPTQWFVLGQKEKISLFLNLIFFSEKNFQLNYFSQFFLALETCFCGCFYRKLYLLFLRRNYMWIGRLA